MLGKVMKYEWKALGRTMWPLFGAGLAATILVRLLYHISGWVWAPAQGMVHGFTYLFGIMGALAVFILAFVIVLMRFYKSMVKGEAYLTFTLPVKAGTHIWGRTWPGAAYIMLSLVTGFAMAFIAIPEALPALKNYLGHAYIAFSVGSGQSMTQIDVPLHGGQLALFVLMSVALVAVSIICSLNLYYASIGLGSNLTRSRLLGSVLGYFIISTVESILTFPLLLPFTFALGRSQSQFNAFFNNFFEVPLEQMAGKVLLFLGGVYLAACLLNLLFLVGQTILAKHYFTKKLNLE